MNVVGCARNVESASTPGNRLSGKPGCWLLRSQWVGPGGLLSHQAARGRGLSLLGTNPGLDRLPCCCTDWRCKLGLLLLWRLSSSSIGGLECWLVRTRFGCWTGLFILGLFVDLNLYKPRWTFLPAVARVGL